MEDTWLYNVLTIQGLIPIRIFGSCIVVLPPPPPPPPHTQFHMGNCAEDTAKKYDVSRLEQDEYAKRSYANSARATESGVLGREIVPVSVPQKKGKPDVIVKHDEEYLRYVSVASSVVEF